MSLTDNWKAGTIEDGFYYVLTETEETAIAEAQCGDLLVDIPEMILKVLEPVPSYEELQKLESDRLAKIEGKEIIAELKSKLDVLETSYDFDTSRLEREVKSLKELLKECKGLFKNLALLDYKQADKIITHINKVI